MFLLKLCSQCDIGSCDKCVGLDCPCYLDSHNPTQPRIAEYMYDNYEFW